LEVEYNVSEWTDRERTAFWTFVRGRMAERGLKHDEVAADLHLDRSALTRRLNGLVKERPLERTVQQLATTLRLDDGERQRLFLLATRTQPSPDAEQRPVMVPLTAQPRSSEPPHRCVTATRRSLLRMLISMLVAIVVVFTLVGLRPWQRRHQPAAAHSPLPGGLWITPTDGDVIAGPIHSAARAYRTNTTDPAIAFVQFTVSWEGRPGPWLVACRVVLPTRDDVYQCVFDPSAAGSPPGLLHLSFDVYDQATPPHINFAPHGVRSIRYSPEPVKTSNDTP